jgi:flagellar hook-associated protein 1 FlgK
LTQLQEKPVASDLLGVSLTGLRVAQSNLLVVSNNVANVNTPGYSRQVAIQSTNEPSFSGAGYFGQGANIQTVERIYNQFLGAQSLQAASFADGFEKYDALVSSLLNRLGSAQSGINAALDGFYAAVQDFSVRPSEVGPRQALLGAAQTLTARFRSFDEQLTQIRQGVNQEIEGTARTINQNIKSIAELNNRIVLATATAQGRPPNDLLDQRDRLVRSLAEQIEIATVPQDDGALNVFMSNGQSLIVGEQFFQMAYNVSADDPRGFTLQLTTSGGSPVGVVAEAQLRGGRLGALLDFARVPTEFNSVGQPADLQGGGELYRAQADIGRLSIAIAARYNELQQTGLDLDGQYGDPLFALGQPRVFANPANVSTGAPTVAQINTPNTIRDLQPIDYELRFTSPNWEIRALPEQPGGPLGWQVLGPSGPFNYQGLNIDVSTVSGVAPGDRFLLVQSLGAASAMQVLITDPRGLAASQGLSIESVSPGLGVENFKVDLDVLGGVLPSPVTIEFQVLGPPPLTYQWRENLGPWQGLTLTQPTTTMSSTAPPGLWTFELRGIPKTGDVIKLDQAGPSDNRNAVEMGRLAVSQLIDGFTLTDKYSALISGLGTRGAEIRVAKEARAETLRLIDNEIQSFSGVNLDEEAANLIKFQQAYGAAGRVLSTASRLFQDFLAAIS